MKMKNSVKLIFASALLLTAASCAKDVALQVPGENPVRFDVGVDGTKATLVNKEDETAFTSEGFSVIAYEGSKTERHMNKVAVTWSGDAWTYTGEYLWRKGTTMKFFGYYPNDLATALDSKTTKDGISAFTYSPLESGITADIKGQTDDYMLATYNGQGDGGKAPLNFTHPLASIQFKVGEFSSTLTPLNIKNIAIGGFYTSATCTPTCGTDAVTYAWSSQSGTADDGALEQGSLSLTPAKDAFIGTPFLLIPGQDFSDKDLTVLLTVTMGSKDKTLLATIDEGVLVQGKTTTCTINYSEGNALSFSCELTDWVESESDKKDIEVEEPVPELEISTLQQLLAFKDQIESPTGKDYSGYTIKINNQIEIIGAFEAIYDQHKRLNGATIEGYQGGSIRGQGWENSVIVQNSDDNTNRTVGLFSTLKSDNVTFKDLSISSLCSSGTGASFIAGTYEGSQITIDNCTFSDLQSHNSTSSVTGSIIGICKGNATISDCNFNTIFCNVAGNYTSLVIGEADGAITIIIENVNINQGNFVSDSINYNFGIYVGHCKNFTGGMNIVIKDCKSRDMDRNENWPALGENTYIHTGTGMIDGAAVDPSHHFWAVAWNNQGSDNGLSVSISGMELANCTLN